MKRLTFLFIAMFLITSNVSAKLYCIDIKKTLTEAKTIKTITVIGYKDSIMLYSDLNSKDTLSISCKSKRYSEPFRLTLIEKNVMSKSDLAGKWPETGQQVLIVVNQKNKISLFANKIGEVYRFWDPNSIPFANSFFKIPKEKSFKPLENCKDQGQNNNDAFWTCFDGCLMNAIDLIEK